MKPIDLRLPEKFKEFRAGQLEMSAKIATSSKYAFLLDAPTGSGKSLLAATVQRLREHKIIYIVTTKQLQDQILRDFSYAKTIKGKSNYPCLKYKKLGLSADSCTHTKTNECSSIDHCPYRIAKKEALGAELAVLNMAYFLNEANYVGGFSDQKYAIIDECDTTESQLMSYIEFVVTNKQLAEFRVEPPKFKTKFESWIEWANKVREIVIAEQHKLAETMDSPWYSPEVSDVRRMTSLERFIAKLGYFVSNVDTTWIWYPEEERWTFKPVWVAKFGETYIWSHFEKVLCMSATILDARQFANNVGIVPKHDCEYLSIPSPFPKENRPVYVDPVDDIIYANMDRALPRLASKIQEIMNKYPTKKILVHCVSYQISKYLVEKIRSPRIITHSAKDRASQIDLYKASDRPLVMISPSMDRGIDLPGDLCDVVIIAKVPYPSLGDPRIKKRVYGSSDGNSWYAHHTISTIIQAAGRATRSIDDHTDTFILDAQFSKLYKDYKFMFPPWFRESIVF